MYSLLTVGKNIRKSRMEKNYSQDYLAAKLGLSQNGYTKIELGYTNISLHQFSIITQILEVSMDELLTGLNLSLIAG